jgi:septal ring factor EnvC (AmiA/AmiB activator)
LIGQIEFQNVIIKKLECVVVEKDRMIKLLQKESSNCASFFRGKFVAMSDYTDSVEEQLKLSRDKEKVLASELSVMKDNYASLEHTVGGLGVDMMSLASDVCRLERNRDSYEERIEKLEDALVDMHQAATSREEFLKERLTRSWSELCTALECLAVAEAKLSKFIIYFIAAVS